jgi:hypothetical protein
MKGSLQGICVGLLFFFGSFALLFWNEGRAVKRQKDLDEGLKLVTSVSNSSVIDTSKANKLVYVYGDLKASPGTAPLYDPIFKLTHPNAFKYQRKVEMYQWQEKKTSTQKKTSNGGTTTTSTYTYSKAWSLSLIASSSFQETSGHENPSSFLVEPLSLDLGANKIKLGAYFIGNDIYSRVNWFEHWKSPPVNVSALHMLDVQGARKTQLSGDTVYIANSTTSNVVGDTRVYFSVVTPDSVSVVCLQTSSGYLTSYTTSGGRNLFLFHRGLRSPGQLFADADASNTATTWICRFAGWLLMFVGICIVLQPIVVFVDIIPLVGDCMEGCIGGYIIPFVAFCISFPFSLLTISIAWIFYRPVFAAISVIFALITLYVLHKVFQSKPKVHDEEVDGQTTRYATMIGVHLALPAWSRNRSNIFVEGITTSTMTKTPQENPPVSTAESQPRQTRSKASSNIPPSEPTRRSKRQQERKENSNGETSTSKSKPAKENTAPQSKKTQQKPKAQPKGNGAPSSPSDLAGPKTKKPTPSNSAVLEVKTKKQSSKSASQKAGHVG